MTPQKREAQTAIPFHSSGQPTAYPEPLRFKHAGDHHHEAGSEYDKLPGSG